MRGPKGATVVCPRRLGMTHKQTPKTKGNSQATGEVRGAIPGPKGLGQPYFFNRETRPVLNLERSKAEALPHLSREAGTSPSHPGA